MFRIFSHAHQELHNNVFHHQQQKYSNVLTSYDIPRFLRSRMQIFLKWQNSETAGRGPRSLIKILFPRIENVGNAAFSPGKRLGAFRSAGVSSYILRHMEANHRLRAATLLPIPAHYFYSMLLVKPYLWSRLLIEFYSYYR